MSDVFMLTRQQLNRIKPYFPVSHGIPREDDRRVLSGIISVIRYGLQWKDTQTEDVQGTEGKDSIPLNGRGTDRTGEAGAEVWTVGTIRALDRLAPHGTIPTAMG